MGKNEQKLYFENPCSDADSGDASFSSDAQRRKEATQFAKATHQRRKKATQFRQSDAQVATQGEPGFAKRRRRATRRTGRRDAVAVATQLPSDAVAVATQLPSDAWVRVTQVLPLPPPPRY